MITLNLISVDKISQRGGEREEESKLGSKVGAKWGGGGIRPWGALGFTANWQLAAQIAMSCKCTQ